MPNAKDIAYFNTKDTKVGLPDSVEAVVHVRISSAEAWALVREVLGQLQDEPRTVTFDLPSGVLMLDRKS